MARLLFAKTFVIVMSVVASSVQLHLAPGTTTADEFDPTSPGNIVSREEARRVGWPCWSGPYQNFRAIACGHELVDDLHQAKLVWQSEEVTPVAKAFQSQSHFPGGRHGETQKGLYAGGGASPIIADGRVL